MVAHSMSSSALRPQVLTTARPRAPVSRLAPTLAPLLPSRRSAVVANARNFKTRDTEVEIQRNTPDSDEIIDKFNGYVDQLKAKWDETDEKPAVVAIGVSAFIVIWALSGLVDRIDKLPLVGGFLELVGLLVTGWFTYRYLTFAPDREELKKNVDSFYRKVTGKTSW